MANKRVEGSEGAEGSENSENSEDSGVPEQRTGVAKRKAENKNTGQVGEDLAADYLEAEGWTIVARNYTTHIGEIDLIVQRTFPRGLGQTQILAFVEVKTRRNTRRASPAATVTAQKRKKLSVLARLFVKKHGLRHAVCRFDVIAVDLGTRPATLTHYENAFDVLGRVR